MIGSLTRTGEASAAGRSTAPQADFHPDRSYFDRPGTPFGTAGLDLCIGPIRMRLMGLSEEQKVALGNRFRPFAAGGRSVAEARGAAGARGGAEARGDADLSIAVGRAAVGRFLRTPAAGEAEIYRLESRVEAGRASLWSYEFAGWVEAGRRRARLDLVDAEGALFDRGLENFLRVMTASFILERGGFLLHGSGVVRGGRAYVFFGPSGAGKTTVTDLSPDDVVLSDDLTLVVRGDDGAYAAAGIPFGMAHHRVPETSGSFPIASLNRLVQSPAVRREPIRGAQAVAEVAASLPFVMQETRQSALAMEAVEKALRSVPVYRLHFRKDGSFWKIVEGA